MNNVTKLFLIPVLTVLVAVAIIIALIAVTSAPAVAAG